MWFQYFAKGHVYRRCDGNMSYRIGPRIPFEYIHENTESSLSSSVCDSSEYLPKKTTMTMAKFQAFIFEVKKKW